MKKILNKNAVLVYGEGKFGNVRQKYTDYIYEFYGTKEEARIFFQTKHPAQSIVITTQPRKRK